MFSFVYAVRPLNFPCNYSRLYVCNSTKRFRKEHFQNKKRIIRENQLIFNNLLPFCEYFVIM